MPSGITCVDRAAHRHAWVVECRNHHHSAFNGYRTTYSAYSRVRCTICQRVWRTNAQYVDTLPTERHP